MHASVLGASLLALVAAVPATLAPRADPTAVWVSVDDDGLPVTTATPKVSTVSGTPTIIDAPPYEVTGTVFTLTVHAEPTVSTGSMIPGPTGKKGNPAGAFPRCFKKEDEKNAPFCEPAPGSQLFVGETYYVTWDPDFFKQEGNNTIPLRISIQGNKINSTTGGIGQKSFSTSDTFPATYGFFAWKIESSMLEHNFATNVSLLILASKQGSPEKHEEHRGPTVLLDHKPIYHAPKRKLPQGAELYIALPTVFGVIMLLVCGTCLWNRKHRRIEIGNIMSRSRHGYGIGKSRAKRIATDVRKSLRKKEQGILLRDFDAGNEEFGYVDRPIGGTASTPSRPRRASDDLGSLAGTPVIGGFEFEETRCGKSAFRDEIGRQERDRR